MRLLSKYPAYLNLTKQDLQRRVVKAYKILKSCHLCPRKCGVNRLKNEKGFCKLGSLPMVSSYHPHFDEEECLVGRYGSGTIFFTYCNLGCVYCQNYEISQLGYGEEISIEKLAEIMIIFQDLGCHNINLVTPTSQIPQILAALEKAIKNGLRLPLIYNTNAYDSLEALKLLNGVIDIYMPDTKYSTNESAIKFSSAANYFKVMKVAIKEMHRQVGDLIITSKDKIKNIIQQFKSQNLEEIPEGLAIKGLLIRHLVLPGGIAGTEEIMNFLTKEISVKTFVNIMDQYRPYWKAVCHPPLNRQITFAEYQEAREIAKRAGLERIYP